MTAGKVYAIVRRLKTADTGEDILFLRSSVKIKNHLSLYIVDAKHYLCLFAAIFIVFAAGVASAAESYPSPGGTAVNDFAKCHWPDNAAKMESLRRKNLQKTAPAVHRRDPAGTGTHGEMNLYVTGSI